MLRISGKVKKTDPKANYMGPEEGPFRCGNCEYFSEPNKCKKVDGEIEKAGCCNLFEKK